MTVTIIAFTTHAFAMESSKIYIRSDLGCQFHEFDHYTELKGLSSNIGVGYTFSNNIKADLTLNLSKVTKIKDEDTDISDFYYIVEQEATKNIYTPDDDTKVTSDDVYEIKNMGLMANIYYDFNHNSELNPYIIAGIGISSNLFEVTPIIRYTSKGNNIEQVFLTRKSKNLTTFTYQLGIGFEYEVNKNIYLNSSYRISGLTGVYKTAEHINNIGSIIQKADDIMGDTCKTIQTIDSGIKFTF